MMKISNDQGGDMESNQRRVGCHTNDSAFSERSYYFLRSF
jgi:hypothetical protein